MVSLVPVDSVEVLVLVDNITDNLSSVHPFVETEIAALGRRRRGAWVLSGGCLCCAAHGLSCLITTRIGSVNQTLLFDAGPEDQVFEQNVSRLGADLEAVRAIVLSHGHWDHGGAMLRALQIIRDRNGGNDIPFYAHPDMFRSRALKLPDGTMRLMEDVPDVQTLTSYGARVVETTDPQFMLENTAYLSGEIARVSPFEMGLPGQHRRTRDGRAWELDELLMDERFRRATIIFSVRSNAFNSLLHECLTWIQPSAIAMVRLAEIASPSNRNLTLSTCPTWRGARAGAVAIDTFADPNDPHDLLER